MAARLMAALTISDVLQDRGTKASFLGIILYGDHEPRSFDRLYPKNVFLLHIRLVPEVQKLLPSIQFIISHDIAMWPSSPKNAIGLRHLRCTLQYIKCSKWKSQKLTMPALHSGLR